MDPALSTNSVIVQDKPTVPQPLAAKPFDFCPLCRRKTFLRFGDCDPDQREIAWHVRIAFVFLWPILVVWMIGYRTIWWSCVALFLVGCSVPQPISYSNNIPPTRYSASSLLPATTTAQPATTTNFCLVAWAQDANGVYSGPTNVCFIIESNHCTAWWDEPVFGGAITNYVLGWSRSPTTNTLPGPPLSFTNTGLSTSQSFWITPPVTIYGLVYLQSSTNGTDFYDMTPAPYLRLTNGLTGTVPWQAFRSRTENTPIWK